MFGYVLWELRNEKWFRVCACVKGQYCFDNERVFPAGVNPNEVA